MVCVLCVWMFVFVCTYSKWMHLVGKAVPELLFLSSRCCWAKWNGMKKNYQQQYTGVQCVYVCVCVSVCARACVFACWCGLTKLANFENLTEHLGQLDAAAAKRTLVLVFSTTVLQDDLKHTQSNQGYISSSIIRYKTDILVRIFSFKAPIFGTMQWVYMWYLINITLCWFSASSRRSFSAHQNSFLKLQCVSLKVGVGLKANTNCNVLSCYDANESLGVFRLKAQIHFLHIQIDIKVSWQHKTTR